MEIERRHSHRVCARLPGPAGQRELEVFRLIGQGHGTRRIAEELHLSVKTVESYREHIKEKMTLGDASELVRYAIQWMEQEKSQ
jgi:DNA-binding NarL/FixJ family response regulator